MLKNNSERKQWIENEDNYEIITVSEFARYRKSRPLDNGSCIVIIDDDYYESIITNSYEELIYFYDKKHKDKPQQLSLF